MALIEFKNLPDKTTALSAENLNHNFQELQGKILGYEIINELETAMLPRNAEQSTEIAQNANENKSVVNKAGEST